ncbi:MAG: hypothetical protein ACI90G_001698, partial [Urechidicola sp.]
NDRAHHDDDDHHAHDYHDHGGCRSNYHQIHVIAYQQANLIESFSGRDRAPTLRRLPHAQL